MAFTFLLGTEDGNTITTEADDPILLYEFATENSISYGLTVDWDGDGEFNDGHEEDNVLKWTADRGRERLIGAPGSGFEPYRVGTLRVELDNSTGRYNPWNTAGALYGNLEPGNLMQFKAAMYSSTDALGYTSFDIFTGYVSDLQQNGWNQRAMLTCEDGIGLLKDIDVQKVMSRTYTNIQDVFSDILSLADYPYSNSVSTDDPTTDNHLKRIYLSGFALTELENLSNSKLGSIAAEADGKFVYHSIYESDTSIELTDSILLNKPVTSNPWDFKREVVEINADNIRSHESIVDFDYLGMSDSNLIIDTGETYIFNSSARPYINASYTTTDYENNQTWTNTFGGFTTDFESEIVLYGSTSDAVKDSTSLSNLTTDFSISVDFGVHTSEFELTNTSGELKYIYRVTVPYDADPGAPIQYTIEDMPYTFGSTSENSARKLFKESDNKYFYYQSIRNYASPPIVGVIPVGDQIDGFSYEQIDRINRMGSLLLNYLSTSRPNFILQMEGRPTTQFLLDVEKRVTYNSSLLGINADYRIAGLKHETLSTTQGIRTTIYLYPVIPSST